MECENDLGNKIQKLMERKRQVSIKFHCCYRILIGLLFALMLIAAIAFVPNNLAKEVGFSLLALVVALVALSISLKSLFLDEVNTIYHWLPILYDQSEKLANSELDKIIKYEKKLSRDACKSISLGISLGVVLSFFAVLCPF